MTRTRKLAALLLLVAVVAVSVLTAAFATDNTKTYAYLPDHSVYFYDVAEGYAWACLLYTSRAGKGGRCCPRKDSPPKAGCFPRPRLLKSEAPAHG